MTVCAFGVRISSLIICQVCLVSFSELTIKFTRATTSITVIRPSKFRSEYSI